jgi:decaprenylphospho-beta-D-erythro-pentofuranosid-2-ulose 2-reductase
VNAVTRVTSLLVLGGTSEIGVATAKALARRGATRVILAGRDIAAMAQAAEDIKTAGATDVDRVEFDAAALGEHGRFIDQVFDHFGEIDAVLIAFGLLGQQLAMETDAEAAVELINVNFTGAVSVAIPIVKRLRGQGHGYLAVLSSVAAERPRRANFIYASTKAGLDAFFQGLTDSLVGTGIEVLVVRPGFVHTKMTAGRPPQPMSTTADRVGEAIADALGRGSTTIWVPASLRAVFAGLRHLPRPLFRRISS